MKWAYNLIWNEYYRDENLQEPVDKDNEQILYRSWKKDYFTSALLSQQRGLSPVMPVNGAIDIFGDRKSVVSTSSWTVASGNRGNYIITKIIEVEDTGVNPSSTTNSVLLLCNRASSSQQIQDNVTFFYSSAEFVDNNHILVKFINTQQASYDLVSVQETGTVTITYAPVHEGSGSLGAGFDIKDLRQAFQIQKWLELANRGGVRYTEFLRAFFGVSPREDRLQRPEYIGGSKSPVIVSEVLQTNASQQGSTPLAYMAGRGVGASKTYIGSYSATEYGLVFGLMSFTTPPVYTQGIDRQFLRRSKYDFLFPQFTGLSEQAIEGAEVFATEDETENRKVWGFNEVYDELRSMTNKVVGKMRTVFRYWHLARFFTEKPALNADFIEGKDVSKRIFAVQSEDGFIVNYANIIKAVRPLPKYGTPTGV